MAHNNVIAEMVLADLTPVYIWAVLIVLTVPAMLVLGNPHGLRDPGRAFREVFAAFRRHAKPADAGPAQADATEAARFADEMQASAERADAAAHLWAERRLEVEREQQAAWQAWLDAETRLRDSLAATAFGTPWSVPTCSEYASRERFLHRSVAEAVDRGDLPPLAAADAVAGRGGWDARLHPLEQELVIHRTAAQYRRQRYDLAAEAERAAWHDADLALRSAGSLRRASIAATARAAELAHLVPGAAPAGSRTPRAAATLVPRAA